MPNTPQSDNNPTVRPMHRYRVLSTWGDVPEGVATADGTDDKYLVYDKWKGNRKSETIVNLKTGDIVGGWTMLYAGNSDQ